MLGLKMTGMRPLFFFLLLLAISTPTLSQAPQKPDKSSELGLDIRLERQSTGGGHDNITALAPGISYGKSSLHVGLFVENGHRKLRGLAANYLFFPTRFSSGAFHPYFQYSFLHRWDSRLTSSLEGILHDDLSEVEKLERYRTFEHYGGFGVQVEFLDRIFLDLGIGLGFYTSELTSRFDNRVKDPERFRRGMDASLSMSLGVGVLL